MDSHGKPIHRYSVMSDDDNGDGPIQQQIARSESIRRTATAFGRLEPARQTIMAEHGVTEETFSFLCHNSPFVPRGHEGLYANGIARYFQGDTLGAIHILTPQFENSLRHVLRMAGHDVTKINNDMTQEDFNFSVMMQKLRLALDGIFGSNWVAAIDSVFNYRGGPNLRNAVAHGHLTDGAMFSEDIIYACWLVLRMCCVPLLPHWDNLAEAYSVP
jgi:uncharacterized protein DUF4209